MTREEAVQSLVRFDKPLGVLRDCVGAFPFDWEGPPLATLEAKHLLSVLRRWEQGKVSAKEVEDWANLVEVRDDLDHDPTTLPLPERCSILLIRSYKARSNC